MIQTMSHEYNSMLLVKLAKAKQNEEIMGLLEEIEDIGDPVFLYPIYEAYKSNKNMSFSHYFLSAINAISSEYVLEIALEIGEDVETSPTDMDYILQIFDKRKAYGDRELAIAKKSLTNFIKRMDGDDEFTFYGITGYLKNTGRINEIGDDLLKIFLNPKFGRKSQEHALWTWIKIDPIKNIQHIIDKYDRLKTDMEIEVIITKVVTQWRGPKTQELLDLIQKEGGTEAKLIVSHRKAEEERKTSIRKEGIKDDYSNAKIIEEIALFREKINAESTERFGFNIFPQNEALFCQLRSAYDSATIMQSCSFLRDFIQKVDGESLSKHKLVEDEIKKLLPYCQPSDYGKSINSLFLFLHSNKITIDGSVF